MGGERRSRGVSRERAILSAVIGLLGEAGYEAMTMDAVAAMMSGLVHAMRADPELAGSLRSMFDEDSVSAELVARAVGRGELPADDAARLAPLVHEVVEAQVFRQIAAGGELGQRFAGHLVDDIVLPLLAGSAARGRQQDAQGR